MATCVPPLQLRGLAQAQQLQQEQFQSGYQQQTADGADGMPLMTPGRASARTRARAQLRAKARARRREEQSLQSAREHENMSLETSRIVETISEEWEAERNEEAKSPSISAAHSSSMVHVPTGGCWSQLGSTVNEEDSDASDSSSEGSQIEGGDVCAAASAASGAFLSIRSWEFPLSAAERKARVMLLFGQNEVLGECQIRKSERLAERLRAKVRIHKAEADRLRGEVDDVRKLRVDVERLRRERHDVCGEAANLRSENKDLKEKVRDLQRRLQQSQQAQAEAASTRMPGKPPVPVSGAGMDWQSLTSARVSTAAPSGSHPGSCRSSLTSNTTPTETPRSLSLTTPRAGTGRAGMRGTIASIHWPEEVSHAPWVLFVCRATANERLYGRHDQAQEEFTRAHAAHLRRGEYISSIEVSSIGSTASSCVVHFPLARCLRIWTSENQEIVIGDATSSIDFCFKADPEHEIVGLNMQDGFFNGIKQAVLAPSRVNPVPAGPISGSMVSAASATSAPIAWPWTAGAKSLRREHTAPAVGIAAGDQLARSDIGQTEMDASRRQHSLEVLNAGRARRIKEAVE